MDGAGLEDAVGDMRLVAEPHAGPKVDESGIRQLDPPMQRDSAAPIDVDGADSDLVGDSFASQKSGQNAREAIALKRVGVDWRKPLGEV